MNKLIRFILSSRRNMIICGILVLIAASVAIYTGLSLQNNMKQMAAQASETSPYFPDYPASNPTNKDPALVKRGEYLTKAGDCIACHTNAPKKGIAFAGGLPMRTPFGTIYSPNITPDKETGIGNWTDEQFITAMTKGISPQGHYYYPAFPYYYFSSITHDDLLAIKAYLDSLPAVHQENHANEMMKPFNIRFLQLGWRELFFRSQELLGGYKADPKKSTEWNRGAYLVEGLGHCAMCHSPSYHILTQSLPLGAPIKKYDLTGAPIQGYLAPNISKSNLENISDDEIVKVFTEDRLIGGGKVEGPMLEANHDSLRYLSQEDLHAIAKYLKSVQSTLPPKPKSSGGPGASIYEGYCAGCHAMGSGGAPKFGDPAAWDSILKAKVDDVYANAIHGIAGMPAKGTCLTCSDAEIKQAVDYMLSAAKGETGTITVIKVPKAKELTIADGKRIYEKDCAVCHDAGFKNAPKPGDQKAWEPIVDQGFFKIYQNVMSSKAHITHGACPDCSDEEIKAAIKYMLQSSTTTNDYELW